MCGIGGFVGYTNDDLSNELCIMGERMRHRGPDGQGFLRWDGSAKPLINFTAPTRGPSLVSFVHRRLSILDLSDHGNQPMATADGNFSISFNGEIYNHLELRTTLESEGHRFSSNCDTEVFLHAFAAWGPACLNKLIGMYAFAILDVRKRTVTLGRDPFGIKPLYFHRSSKLITFASEIPTMLEVRHISRRADHQGVSDYLRYGFTDHRAQSMFLGIELVPSAHILVIPVDRPQDAKTLRYWSLDPALTQNISIEEASKELASRFENNVRLHLRSDVPIGGALSGGLDSSSIFSIARKLEPDLPLTAISFIPSDPTISEENWIDVITNDLSLLTVKVALNNTERSDELDLLVRSQGEPFRGSGVAAQRAVFRGAADAGLKVMLNGQGADELLGGYRAYASARAASLIGRGKFVAAWRLLHGKGLQPGAESKFALTGRAVLPLLPRYLGAFTNRRILGGDVPEWMNATWLSERQVTSHTPQAESSRRTLTSARANDLMVQGLPALLRYEDRNSMAFSVESRVPFLTPDFAQWLFALPEAFFIAKDGTSKLIFRDAMNGALIDSVRTRRDKFGYTTSLDSYLTDNHQWVETTLTNARDQPQGPIKLESINSSLQDVRSQNQAVDFHLWRALNLLRWSQLFGIDLSE